MRPGAISTPIDPSVVARVSGADAWFGPLDPLPPAAPPSVAGRQFDYLPGWNLQVLPRGEASASPMQLRALADNCDLVRLAIETRKDQLAALDWTIRPKGQAGGSDPRADRACALFAWPDREHAWDEWVRMLVEDMLVLDAATIYPRRSLGGGVLALEPVDGGTIKRVLDDSGRTPSPPLPAYQQILKGLPAVDYTADALIYLPRNPRTNRVYGLSPVEQIELTINIALRRQFHKLEYYTEGSMPDAFLGVPDDWTTDQLKQYQEYWDGLMAGNTAERRRLRFIHGDVRYVETKPAILKDDFDEWLARIVSFAFSLSPTPFVRQMNRATAETQDDQALREGLAPLMRWLKRLVDRILARALNWPDLELVWLDTTEQDPKAQAEIAVSLVAAGIQTRNEARAVLGLPPLPGGDALTVAGPVAALGQVLGGDGALAKAGFDPDEARDERGRWTAGGGGPAVSSGSLISETTARGNEGVNSHAEAPTSSGPNQVAQAEPPPETEGEPEIAPSTSEDDPLNELIDPSPQSHIRVYEHIRSELERIEPGNPKTMIIVPRDWVPSDEDIEDIAKELRAARERVAHSPAAGQKPPAPSPKTEAPATDLRPQNQTGADRPFERTEPVQITGSRAIDIAPKYEAAVRERYGNSPFQERKFEITINGTFVSGVADDVVEANGVRTAIEVKYVQDWNLSPRNPASSSGDHPWARVEQESMIAQARTYAAAFKGGVTYVTNSEEFAEYYAHAFHRAGITNFKFVITPTE